MPRPVEFTMPALRQPVNPFFEIPKKFFGTKARHRALPAGMDTIRKSFVPERAFRVKYFFQFFSHFYFQLFQVLMHMLKIFFKSSMILASYVFLFVLNCNTRVHVRACKRKTCYVPQNGTETALESLKGLFPYHDISFPFSWLTRPFLRHFGAYVLFRKGTKKAP